MKSNKIIIGTRGSILALAQAEKVKEMLIAKYDELRKKEDFKGISDFNKNESLTIELKIIVTTGDKDLRDFDKIKGTTQKELFVKEIEKEMLENKIDFAVHSLKDMPQQTPEGLLNACFPLREDNRDVIVSKSGKKLNELREKSVIGTGSIRRETELLNLRKDIIIKPIRGNIHTRLKKLDNGEYDAIILAAAGLKRTGLSDRITEYFEDEVLEIINDKEVGIMCEAEREFSRIFDGGCHTPIGCSSTIEGNTLKLKGVYNKDGKRIFSEIEGDKNNPKEIAQKLAKEIKNNE